MAALPSPADDGITYSASGDLSTYGELTRTRSPVGSGDNQAVDAVGQAILRLSAGSPSFMFQTTVAATQAGMGIPSADVREAEVGLFLPGAVTVRSGRLLRNFSFGGYGSPANPFVRAEGAVGYWGVEAEWTPATSFSMTGIVSADRAVANRAYRGPGDLDGGAVLRWSPGIVDAAVGLYASGNGSSDEAAIAAGTGELRLLTYSSVTVLGFLASFEGALSLPVYDPGGARSASIRVELRRSIGIGPLSLELGAAYRGIYPGRDDAGIASLLADLPASGIPADPFAPFYGRDYLEALVYMEWPDVFALSINAGFDVPKYDYTFETRLDVWLGDAGLFIKVIGLPGGDDSEWYGLARSFGMPWLTVQVGVGFSF
jgi:hypothetical protein